jgi:hypothetical protein
VAHPLGEALTRLSTALTRRGDYAVRAALCLAKRGGSSQYVKIQFIAASPSLVDREVASYETPGGDRRVDWRYRRASSVEQDLVTSVSRSDYQANSAAVSAQLPGEALHCADVEGRRSATSFRCSRSAGCGPAGTGVTRASSCPSSRCSTGGWAEPARGRRVRC